MRKYADLAPPDCAPTLTFSLPELRYPARLNAVEAVLEGARAAGWSARTAFLQGNEIYSFDRVARLVHRYAAGFRALGIGRGDTVILRIPDTVDLVASLLAVQAIGAIAMPTYIQLRTDDLIYRANDAGARLLLCDAALL